MTGDLFVPSLSWVEPLLGMEVGYLDTGCIVPLLVMLSKLKKLKRKYFHNREDTVITIPDVTRKLRLWQQFKQSQRVAKKFESKPYHGPPLP